MTNYFTRLSDVVRRPPLITWSDPWSRRWGYTRSRAITRLLSALCHTHISTSDKVLSPRLPRETPKNHICKIWWFSNESDHVTKCHILHVLVTSCHTLYFELKFTENGDNNLILMISADLGGHRTPRLPITTRNKNFGEKNFSWRLSDTTMADYRKQTKIYDNFLQHFFHKIFSCYFFITILSLSPLIFYLYFFSATGFPTPHFTAEDVMMLLHLFLNSYLFFGVAALDYSFEIPILGSRKKLWTCLVLHTVPSASEILLSWWCLYWFQRHVSIEHTFGASLASAPTWK